MARKDYRKPRPRVFYMTSYDVATSTITYDVAKALGTTDEREAVARAQWWANKTGLVMRVTTGTVGVKPRLVFPTPPTPPRVVR